MVFCSRWPDVETRAYTAARIRSPCPGTGLLVQRGAEDVEEHAEPLVVALAADGRDRARSLVVRGLEVALDDGGLHSCPRRRISDRIAPASSISFSARAVVS